MNILVSFDLKFITSKQIESFNGENCSLWITFCMCKISWTILALKHAPSCWIELTSNKMLLVYYYKLKILGFILNNCLFQTHWIKVLGAILKNSLQKHFKKLLFFCQIFAWNNKLCIHLNGQEIYTLGYGNQIWVYGLYEHVKISSTMKHAQVWWIWFNAIPNSNECLIW